MEEGLRRSGGNYKSADAPSQIKTGKHVRDTQGGKTDPRLVWGQPQAPERVFYWPQPGKKAWAPIRGRKREGQNKKQAFHRGTAAKLQKDKGAERTLPKKSRRVNLCTRGGNWCKTCSQVRGQ